MSYVGPASGGLTVGGAALASRSTEASDGTAPSFTLRQIDSLHVEAAFSEPIALADGSAAPPKEAWDRFAAPYWSLKVRVLENGRWVADMAAGAGVDYHVDVEAGTVTFREDLESYSYTWVVFDPPDGYAGSIVDRADPPNALPDGASATHVGDSFSHNTDAVPATAPPVPAGPGALSVSYSVLPPTGDAPRPEPFGGHARLGDRVVLSLELDSVASAPPTVLFAGHESESDAVAMSPGDGLNEWTATHTVGPEVIRVLDAESGALAATGGGEDGPLAFAASVESVTRGSSVVTHASSETPPPIVDRAAPEILHAAFASADEIVLTLSEHLSGTEASIESAAHAVSSAAAAVPLSAEAGPDYRELWDLSKLALTLASPAAQGASYTVTLPASLTDEAGNPFASRTYTLEYSPVTFTARTSSPTATVVTFASPPGGTLDVSDWSVADDGGAAREVASLALGASTAVGGAAPRAAAVPAGSQETELVITHEALSSTASTPRVSYVPGDLHINETVIDPTTHSTPDSLPFLHGRTGIEELVLVQSRVLGPVTVTASDGIAPTAESAAFHDSSHIDVTFGEPVTVPGSGWTVTSDSGSLAVTSAAAGAADSVARLAVSPATSGVTYTVRVPTALADKATVPNVVAAGTDATATWGDSGTPVDSSPPTFTARTVNATRVEVTFDEPVSGAVAALQWIVAGTASSSLRASQVSNAEVTSLSGATVLYLVTATLAADATPAISFAPPAAPTLADAAGNAVAASTVTAADGIAPTIASATPSLSTRAIVTFSESLRGTTSAGDWTVNGSAPASMRAGVSAGTWVSPPYPSAPLTLSGSDSVMLIMASELARGSAPDVAYTPKASVTDPLADAAGNPLAATTASPPPIVTPTVSPPAPLTTPAAFTARTVNATLVEVTFGKPVTGAVAPSQWTVEGTAAYSIHAAQASASPATSLSGATSLYLVTGTLAANAHPAVSFTPPTTPTLANSDGSIAATTVTAADGIAPTVASAATASATSVTVTFSEPVDGPTAAGEWVVGGAQPVSLRDGTSQPTVAVSASGMTELTLIVTGPLAPDSAPAVRYSPVAGTTGLTDTVSAAAPAHERVTPMRPHSVTATDGIAPTPAAAFAGPRAITVTFDEALASPGTVAGLAYTVTVPDGSADADTNPDTVALSAASPASYDAASRTLTLALASDAPTGVAHTVTLPTSGLADAAGNAVTSAIPAITRVDAEAPTFTAR